MINKFYKKIKKKFRTTPLEKVLKEINNPSFFFIQIGACDGVSFDPIYQMIKKYKWEGILVEPIPYHFNNLKENYSSAKGLTFINKAISLSNKKATMYTISEEGLKHLPKWVMGISSLSDKKNALGKSHWDTVEYNKDINYDLIKKYTEKIEVDCISVNQLIEDHEVKKIDLLQIDAEGHDYEIIKSLDFTKLIPKIINFEFINLTEHEKSDIISYLKSYGYQTQIYKLDLIAIHNSATV